MVHWGMITDLLGILYSIELVLFFMFVSYSDMHSV